MQYAVASGSRVVIEIVEQPLGRSLQPQQKRSATKSGIQLDLK